MSFESFENEKAQEKAQLESKKENTVESREQAVKMIKESFKRKLEKRFGKNSEVPLDYHTIEHSQRVAFYAKNFLEIIKNIDSKLVLEEDLDLVEIEGFGHDIVQNAFRDKAKMLQRHRGFKDEDIAVLKDKGVSVGNERASADEVIQEIGKYQYGNGDKIFSVTDDEIAEDIGTTYPDFNFTAEFPDGTKGIKISQPYLTSESSLRGLALATADLRGDLGPNNDFDLVKNAGSAEFREIQLPIKADLDGGLENILPERRAQIAEAILNWQKSQIAFNKWQKILFLESIENNNKINNSEKAKEIKQKLIEYYSNFDKHIQNAINYYNKLEQEYGDLQNSEQRKKNLSQLSIDKFKELLIEAGYKL